MADLCPNDVAVLQQEHLTLSSQIADNTLQLEQGQRVTDARVSQAHGDLANGQRAIVEDVNNAANHVIREVSTDTQFLEAGQRGIVKDLGDGFLSTAHGQARTDMNVDHGVRHLDMGQRFTDQDINRGFMGVAHGQASTDRNVDHNAAYIKHDIYDLDRDLNSNVRYLERGQRDTDRNVDHNFRWLQHENHEHERHEMDEFRGLERGQRVTDDRVSDGFYRTREGVDRGFAHTNEHLSDAERRIENRMAHYGEENAEAFGDVERRVEGTTRTVGEWVQGRLADSELRMTKNLDDAERRLDNVIHRDVSHNLEEVSEALADHDRRASERLVGIAGEIAREAERTRCDATKNELETRLYLRDREDRTEDLIRQLADRNLDEMRGFERRSRDDEDRTRDLIRHLDAEGAERRYIRDQINNSELRTELAIDRALKCRRDWDDDRVRFDPRINITLDDTVVDDIRNRNSSRNQNNNLFTDVA
jgi:hypothetical protein